MRQYDSISRHLRSFYLITLPFTLLGLSACTTTPPSPDEMPDSSSPQTGTFWFLDAPDDGTSQAVTQTADISQNDNIVTDEPTDNEPARTEPEPAEPATQETAQTEPEPARTEAEPAQTEPELARAEPDPVQTEAEPATQEPVTSLVETEPASAEVFCKNSPYSEYEKQARTSIARGLDATTAATYGVGFRDLDEHKKWTETHNALFTAVHQACVTLGECAKQHPQDKTTQCATQARQFDEWQNLAARFAEKAKQSETTQPPKICSFTANPDDAANCFHALADNIDNTCTTNDCKKTSDCWRGIGFLDGAINQAASACAFVRTPLAECRGYVTATQRRKNKFERCKKMQEGLSVRIIPVL